MNKFAQRLRELLKGNDISKTNFAKALGISISSVSDYCSGKREPSFDILILICKELNEKADYLLGLED